MVWPLPYPNSLVRNVSPEKQEPAKKETKIWLYGDTRSLLLLPDRSVFAVQRYGTITLPILNHLPLLHSNHLWRLIYSITLLSSTINIFIFNFPLSTYLCCYYVFIRPLNCLFILLYTFYFYIDLLLLTLLSYLTNSILLISFLIYSYLFLLM